jgi:esterase/lipase
MPLNKIHIYLVPGLAASPKIFEYLNFDPQLFETHYLEWLIPLSKNETLENYAKRMSELVLNENSILIGVSFGGIMVQEMSNFINVKKVIIVSSIKSKNELPNRLKILNKIKAHKIIPITPLTNIEIFEKLAFNDFTKKRFKLYKKYLAVRDETYLSWAINALLNWKRINSVTNLVHIHGTNDHIFPIKNIQNCIKISGGTHIMILNKAKSLTKIIINNL